VVTGKKGSCTGRGVVKCLREPCAFLVKGGLSFSFKGVFAKGGEALRVEIPLSYPYAGDVCSCSLEERFGGEEETVCALGKCLSRKEAQSLPLTGWKVHYILETSEGRGEKKYPEKR